ncbi:electron transport complex subunit C [Clostridia bacterium]|nr:electron transport complex subunit C [Clostridia bacterium]
MGSGTFKGGVHPYDGKELSKYKQVREILPKGDVIYSLSQHIGAPSKPVVGQGDYVKCGQVIAEADGFVSATVHASVSGKVSAIERRLNATGIKVLSIVIENDGQFTSFDFHETADVNTLSKEEIGKKIQEAGIIGLGGAGFPTHVKLTPKDPDKIKYVIANCAECEPYVTVDYRRMIENAEQLIAGMKIVLQLFDNAKGVFAIEDNKPDCIEKMQELLKNEDRIEVQILHTKYPQGAERQQIFAVTGLAIHSKQLPADVGCIVDNAETFFAIYNAVKLGRPLIERLVTVTGGGIADPSNFLIRIGTNFSELLEAAGGFIGQPEKLLFGGPMMGFAGTCTDVPTMKTTSMLLSLLTDEMSALTPTPCINCGRCVEVCPSGLVPSRLAKQAQRKQNADFEKWNGLECIECACCTYGCPAKQPLVSDIKLMKKRILTKKRQQAAREKKEGEAK